MLISFVFNVIRRALQHSTIIIIIIKKIIIIITDLYSGVRSENRG